VTQPVHRRKPQLKKAFTLIELLVVIAIIAILAAILFPVFAQAKLAAKKTAGLSAVKQIGVAFQLYTGDSDDILPAYRFEQNSPASNINPTYLKLQAQGDPRANLIESNARRCVFFNQVIEPYGKSDALFLNTQNPNAWVNVQDKGTSDPNFKSYGGQNSYGVNNYIFIASRSSDITAGTQKSPLSNSSFEDPSNTLLMTDATYYNVLPAQPTSGFCKLNGYAPNPTTYSHYWKHLGNNTHNFNTPGNSDPDDASNVNVWKNIDARYSGVLNVLRGDTSAKAINARKVVYDLRANPAQSMWNPFKTACEP
jgi:prepilin-type N-terminal cleavage/methylation domain-containing protein